MENVLNLINLQAINNLQILEDKPNIGTIYFLVFEDQFVVK